ncbi:predicted protein [Pyrenophora tritici-repentis Pt-1C-BFP]|uniref:Uncharacterized protein n=1 Tax=Pyrenophora tritici-repentis (strain Pt-1C-BFP) TaxID=426418 RepID=B2W4H9_PYRTR|nr:uncharacterized protein PTRG_04529 [Pyrenophora tritici-repentis Pt-1C-BFP]EDU47436.1 predicted protein [Pyrenophora tritici-repentis Pt-1C-BFP]
MPHWWQFDPTTPTRGQDTPAISDDRGGQDVRKSGHGREGSPLGAATAMHTLTERSKRT